MIVKVSDINKFIGPPLPHVVPMIVGCFFCKIMPLGHYQGVASCLLPLASW